MKKIFAALLVAGLLLNFAGCGKASKSANAASSESYQIDFTGEYSPSTLAIGDTLTVTLHIKNLSSAPLKGFSIYSGDLGDFTVTSVDPQTDFSNGELVFTNEITPSKTADITIVMSPNKAGNEDITFSADESNKTTPLLDSSGEDAMASISVAVTQ